MSARRKTLLTFLIAPLMVALSLIGISVADAAKSTSHHQSQINTPTITISAFAYHTPTGVKKGSLVNVVNKDGVKHTVTNPGGAFNVTVPAHGTRSFHAPGKAGKYRIVCNFHPSMAGVLRVTN